MTPSFPDRAPRAALRARMRERRRSLSPAQRERAARAVLRQLLRLRWLRPGMRVAAYIAIDGELDPSPIAAAALRLGCALYLPRITDFRSRRMRFERATAVSRPNRMRIPEPAAGPGVGAQRLNLVFVPLVAFDPRGERLGMGHGYYDRALAFRRLRSAWPGPRIVGLGYAFQELPLIEEAAHDVRLDAVLTDGATHLFRERKR